ncbi:MAG: cobalamin B12-binding domain-containing protein [Limnohabitans sp.]|jgi:MerR family transcriptional regulator, light-induced transcriptional regulator|nr:cobalamin B12-binding domain-containing protein [Limnohabitans sp.]
MAKFNLEPAQSPPLAEASRHALPEALRQGAPVGPRLVGGTSFTGKSALDLAQIQILAQACLQGLDAARQVVFGWQRQGKSLEDIYLQGITPCARLLGDWWCSDRLDFAMSTIASAHLQQLLHDFSSEFLQETPTQRLPWSLLLLTEPGAQHSLGLFMLSEFFKRAGWLVTVGVPQDVTEFKRLFQSDWFDAVGISVSSDRHLDTLAALLPKLRESSDNLGLQVFVGGPMAFIAPERLQGLAAEVLAEDAPATVSRITQAMAGAAARAS